MKDKYIKEKKVEAVGLLSGTRERGGSKMTSLKRAKAHFSTRKLDTGEYTIGHLSDETAKLIARDLFLIGCQDESEILSGNDTSRYTAIVNRINGQACEVFFDLPTGLEIDVNANDRRGETQAQIPH